MTFFTVPDAASSVSSISKLLNRPTDITSCGSSRINSDNDTTFEPKRKRCRSVRKLDLCLGIGRHGVGISVEES
jgi:hypothetical protein